ncbi:V-set domain-containing T-cell activation inhibitor 1 [Pelobates cultripes]|uniref:V-set domain-containing T-cell activation inhibitor 1 n=1 Tax=Pelobates cultripes TaxID=61616 RepID=A0AAD1VKU0_PELCU|nr:V-set domain-containing T-cell activation inhibitor 1 [Pelobates cultripes]
MYPGFSDLTITGVPPNTLLCESPSWYPQPSVTWSNKTGNTTSLVNLTNTTFTPSLDNMFEVNSSLKEVQRNIQYTCVIQNQLAKAEGDVIWTASGVKTQTRLDIISSAHIPLPPLCLLCVLCFQLLSPLV